MSSTIKTIGVQPLSPALGAEISGIDIVAGIGDAQIAELRQAHVVSGVTFLRDQDINPQQHIDFAERWRGFNRPRHGAK